MLDPRLADEALLRLAALRVKQRQTPASLPPVNPGPAWWAAFWACVRESPYALELLAHVGIPEAEARAFLAQEPEA